MESVEELCDDIALINKARLVITGGVEEIRRKYGNNNVEVEYTDEEGRHSEVLPVPEGGSTNDVLTGLIGQGKVINAFRELMPRMNDIFIKLVTEE